MTRPFPLRRRLPRRAFLQSAAASVSAFALAGCDRLSRTEWFPKVLNAVEPLNEAAAKLVARKGMAQEFAESDRSPTFRSNGTSEPDSDQYSAWVANNFADYRLRRRRARRSAACVLAGRPAHAACAHADHAPRLRRGLERHREVEGGAARRAARRREAEAGGALRDVLLRGPDGERRHGSLLREHRLGRRAPPRRRSSRTT